MRARRVALAAALVVAAAAGAAPAFAQTDEDKATARALADEGHSAYEAGDYPRALDRFERAHALVSAPTISLALARTQAAVGQLVQASETYQRILVEDLGPKPSVAFKRAVEDARKEQAVLKPRIPFVTVEVRDAPAGGAFRVTVDDVDLPHASLGVRRAINPGHHAVRASARGYLSTSRQFTLGDATEERVVLKLVRVEAEVEARPRRGPLLRAVGFAALGGAADAVVVGAVATGLALGRRGALASRCPGDVCPAGEGAAVHAYQDLGGLAWGSVGAAGALGGGGVLLLVATSSRPYGREERPLVPALIGAGVVGLALGGVAGAMTLGVGRELDAACPGGACPASQAAAVTGYRGLATTSVVSLVAGGAIFAAGGAVAFAGRPASKLASAGLSPYVGLGGAGVRGGFE